MAKTKVKAEPKIESERDPFAGMSGEVYVNISKNYSPLPPKLIQNMLKQKVISHAVTPEQQAGMEMLKWTWRDGHQYFLRAKLGSLRKEQRAKLLDTPRLEIHERQVVSLFVKNIEANTKDGTKNTEKGPTIKDIQKLVWETNHVKITKERILQLRQVAYDCRRGRSSKDNKEVFKDDELMKAKNAADVSPSETKMELSPKLKKVIGKVFKDGLSVIEIARSLEMPAGDIYSELAKQALIKPLGRAKKDGGENRINDWDDAFVARGLTVHQWARSWDCDASDVVKAIVGEPITKAGLEVKLTKAFQRDLPGQFKVLFEAEPRCLEKTKIHKHNDYMVKWSDKHNGYFAVAAGLVDEKNMPIESLSETACGALAKVEILVKEFAQITGLKDAAEVVKKWNSK